MSVMFVWWLGVKERIENVTNLFFEDECRSFSLSDALF